MKLAGEPCLVAWFRRRGYRLQCVVVCFVRREPGKHMFSHVFGAKSYGVTVIFGVFPWPHPDKLALTLGAEPYKQLEDGLALSGCSLMGKPFPTLHLHDRMQTSLC